jgi:hypothetical protein
VAQLVLTDSGCSPGKGKGLEQHLRSGQENKRKNGLEPALVERHASAGKSLELAVQIHGTGKVLQHGDSSHVKAASKA